MRAKIKHRVFKLAIFMWMAWLVLFLAPVASAYVDVADANAPSEPAAINQPTVPLAPVQPTEGIATDAEPVATSEIPVAPQPDELPGLVVQAIELIKSKEWPAAIALIIVILLGILKMDMVGNLLTKYVPKRILPLIPLALGVIAGAIYGFISGGWPKAAQVVVESGVLAVVFHQIWTHTVVRKDKG